MGNYGIDAIKTVPNQRTIQINKSPTDKQHLYTANNLQAIDGAAKRLQTKGGFKLYTYLAKNQSRYIFALSSKDFCEWSGLSITSYRTAFKELTEWGYLKKTSGKTENYAFYDYTNQTEKIEERDINNVIIEYPREHSDTEFRY